MADIISSQRKPRTRTASAELPAPAASLLPPAVGDPALLPFVELLFFAYRDFTGEADAALAAYGLGRAHHRVLHFVNRHPAIRVADLLALLKITKQSLSRVLRQLVADGWIEQVPGPNDRRERHLTLTQRGHVLADELAALQTRRIHHALAATDAAHGARAPEAVRQFLLALIAEGDRADVEQRVSQGVTPAGPRNPGGA
jgi:DNA-binding MarR family transcriptional regulator